MTFQPGDYAIANELLGFPIDRLRVRVERVQPDGTVGVRTASLLDAGTYLDLRPTQLTPEAPVMVERHARGLVVFD